MKPGHIRVFDGLRITTEHMEHLQDSFHSAVQDLRQILGLGLVHTGFEVVPDGKSGILVMPGIAFDYQKNRIVSDEPREQLISFGADEAPQFVCLQYAQVEDTPVEGKPTLIWDSCAILVRPSLPEPELNLIPIARLDLGEQGELQITRLPVIEQEAPAIEEPQPGLAPEAEAPEAAEALPAPPAGSQGAGGPVSPMESALPEGEAETTKAEAAPATLPPAETLCPGNASRLVVCQGMLGPQEGLGGKHALAAVLLEPLRQKLSRPNGAGGEANLAVQLVEKELAFDFQVASLSIQGVIYCNLEYHLPSNAEAAGEVENRQGDIPIQVIAQGEAALECGPGTEAAAGQVSQSGLSQVKVGAEAGAMSTARLAEGWLAEFPFQEVLQTITEEDLLAAWQPVAHLRLTVSLEREASQALRLTTRLLWEGGIDEASVTWIETQPLNFNWEAHIAWKAMGEMGCS